KEMIPKLKVVNLILKSETGDVYAPLKDIDAKYEVKVEENGLYSIKLHLKKPEEVLDEILKKYIKCGFEIVSIKMEEPTLEDVFIYFSEGFT
ncbi:MAG: DUF4162 domain-containing protein, partial [Desulfurococcaceae archaeon]